MSKDRIAVALASPNPFSIFAERGASTFISILVAFPIVLVLWRFWAFTIKAALYPDEPKELPYWIPFLGHAIGFVRNGQRVLTRGREYFGHTREPFALTLAGEKIYFLTSPDDVTALYKDTKSLGFDHVVYELSIQFGVSRAAMDKIHRKPRTRADDKLCSKLQIENPNLKSLAQLNSVLFKQHLHPGDEYNTLLVNVLEHLNPFLHPNHLPSAAIIPFGSSERTISLLKWTQHAFLSSSISVLFGEKMQQLDPDLAKNFLTFDNDNWKLWYKWPGGGEMQSAKARVIKTIQTYIGLPHSERQDAAHLVQTIELSQRALGICEKDIATNLAMIFWAANTNTYKLCFWGLAYLLHTPNLLNSIRSETRSALAPNGTISLPHLPTLPQLDAVLHECLRLCNATSSIRIVVEPVVLGGKRFRPGARIVCPSRELHTNTAVYGPDPACFDPERFLRDKTLIRSESYRPFGGGLSYCPGRFVAKQTVKMFVVMALQRFEIGLAGEQKFPAMETGKPTTGLMSPAEGEDVLVKVAAL